MEMFLLQHVVKGRQYYYQHIDLMGGRGEVFLVTAMESRDVGNVTVLVRFLNGDKARVKTDHLHLTAPKSPAELRQIQEAKNEAHLAQMRTEWDEKLRRILADRERSEARLQSLQEDAKRQHLEAQKRRRALEKIENARAKRQHLEAQYRRRALEKKEKAQAKRQQLEAQKQKRALEEKEKAQAKRQQLEAQKRRRANKTRAKNNEKVRRKK